MVFASTEFIFWFLPLFLLCYFGIGALTKGKSKNLTLLIFSLIFYSWGEPVYVLLMVYSTCLDYTCGRMIEKGENTGNIRLKKIFLAVSLVGNLLPLTFFKYLDFLLINTNNLFSLSIPLLNLTMPIGISFYTFQTMSYSIDVYRGKVKAQHNIIAFGTYVTMFPQLIAGPVVRYTYVAEKIQERKETLQDVLAGARRLLVGLAKKVLIANTMAAVCDTLFPVKGSSLGVLGSWVAIIAFAFQIYFDFSGYSDMAIGLGKMTGFDFPENFQYPYISRSITEFWRRWHITMSTFFRDYVYIPLGGNRVSVPRWILNVLIVWALTGLWHGASWNFVLWGLYFALILMLEKFVLKRFLEKTHVLSRIYSLFLILYGWVLFNATDDRGGIPWMIEFTKAMFGAYGFEGTNIRTPAVTQLTYANVHTLFLIVLLCAIAGSLPWLPRLKARMETFSPKRRLILSLVGDFFLLVFLLLSVIQLESGAYNPFIYFRY